MCTTPKTKNTLSATTGLSGETSAGMEQSSTTIKDTYRQSTYFQSLDFVVSELNSRFSADITNKDQAILCALDKIVLKRAATNADFTLVASHYEKDIDILSSESSIFKDFVLTNSIDADTAIQVVSTLHVSKLQDVLPAFHDIACILAAIPATSCNAERSFSMLRRLKTYLRKTMGQERLTSLAGLNIEREYVNKFVASDINRIIDIFGSPTGRRHLFF